MTDRLGVGFPLHADLEYLELARDILERDADYFEVGPETLWKMREGRIVRNGFHALFREIRDRSGKPFVAHGLDFSPGTPLDSGTERDRAERWHARLRDDHAEFRFRWLTEHLGWIAAEDRQVVLPMPLPYSEEAVAVAASRMRQLAQVVPRVGFENSPTLFTLGDPADEPRFFNAICRAAPCGMLLDLHNVHTQCLNFGLDPREYVDRIDLDHVIQIHVSGGSESEPQWAPSGRVFRLDSHDGAVPEPVWSLLERVAPRCRNLGGIVVERLEGTFGEADVPALAGEVRRAKGILRC